ncbi:putative antitoxin VapB44 [Synechococcus sp. RS9909]|uniref:hypothetical protein n=1 Tax=unclassified Synechococcus TaxID=2626047 RepID=UPI0000690720|nr:MULTISPECIES: hypothetical protein [unclassified Synechococcus]EAQ70251.1 hypothetical protein RS9917_05430 [Synechococcus sp. RS9917]QNI78094.1 putative antitoxin VapB44 [Synechococcus sp. RS9909]
MRTTLDIDDDLLQAAKDLAKQQRMSAGQVVSTLLRQALTQAHHSPSEAAARPHPCGFRPFAGDPSRITNNADVEALRDALNL